MGSQRRPEVKLNSMSVLLVLLVLFLGNVDAVRFKVVSKYASPTFTWTVGTPVTLLANVTQINIYTVYVHLYWNSPTGQSGFGYTYNNVYHSTQNKIFNVTSPRLQNNQVIFRADAVVSLAEHHGGRLQVYKTNDGSRTYTAYFTVTYCPNPNSSEIAFPQLTDATFGNVIKGECIVGLPFTSKGQSIGRFVFQTCGPFTQWRRQVENVTCWKGQTIDFAKKSNTKTIIAGNPTIFYCDDVYSNVITTSLTLINITVSGNGFAWVNVTMTSQYHKKTVTCILDYGQSTSQQTITLNVLFPPQSTTYLMTYFVAKDAVGKEQSFTMTFRSNPPITMCGNVTITKLGKEIMNKYVMSYDVVNTVVVHFIRFASGDFGTYDVTVTSCNPVNTVNFYQIHINETAASTTKQTYKMSDIIITATCTVIAMLVPCAIVVGVAVRCRRNKSTSANDDQIVKYQRDGIADANSSTNPKNTETSRSYNVPPPPFAMKPQQKSQTPHTYYNDGGNVKQGAYAEIEDANYDELN